MTRHALLLVLACLVAMATADVAKRRTAEEIQACMSECEGLGKPSDWCRETICDPAPITIERRDDSDVNAASDARGPAKRQTEAQIRACVSRCEKEQRKPGGWCRRNWC